MQLNWIRYDSGEWCKLRTLNLDQEHFNQMSGVYVIWDEIANNRRRYVYVGQGFIRSRLKSHRDNFIESGRDLTYTFATWAAVNDQYKDGIEAFVGSVLMPSDSERFPSVRPIPVNLP